MTSHRQRLETCLAGATADRPPVAFWRHFPVDDQTPDGLAAAIYTFQNTFDLDLIKVTPASSYCLKDWGVDDRWQGSTEGTRTYTKRVIERPEDWERLPVLDPTRGRLADEIQTLRLLKAALGLDTPIIDTIFNPLSQAKNLAGGNTLITHLRRYPDAVHAGLRSITESTRRYIEAVSALGIDGIFYAVQHAQYGLLSDDEFSSFGRRYDLDLLDSAQGFWIKMLHLHGSEVMFDRLVDYPVDIINWHDRETIPDLGGGQSMFAGAVCGGIRQEETMVLGTPDQVRSEARQAIEATGGKRFILGTGCVIPIITPYGNLMAARQAVEA